MGQKLVNRETGVRELIDDDQIDAAIASGKYVTPDAIAVHRTGDDTYTTAEQLALERGRTEAIDPARVALSRGHAIREGRNTGVIAGAKAVAGGAVSGLTAGFVDPFQEEQEFNRGLSTVGLVGGSLLPALFGDEAGLAGAIVRDPVEAERAGAALSSRFLFAGETGAEAGSVARSAERGLARAGVALDDAKAAAAVPQELSTLDAAGLKVARESELAEIQSARAAQSQSFVEDLNVHRGTLKNDDKVFLATKGIKETALPADVEAGALKIQEIGLTSYEADKQINRLLRNPKRLAEDPKLALGALQQQETAFEHLAKREGTLRQMFAADETGTRAAALDRLPAALERNRELQSKVRALIAKPMSERLSAIEAAEDALKAQGKGHASIAETMLGGSIMGHIAGAFTGMPIIGPMLGAKAGQLATDLVFGRLGKATAAIGSRTASASAKFLDIGTRIARKPEAMVLATKALSKVAYGPARAEAGTSLASLYRARTSEIKALTAYGPTGEPMMRPDARAAMAAKLAPIRAVAPQAADKIESLAARRLEFLSSKIPRRPDIDGVPIGPDRWQPSELDMRQFARYAAAVEDPAGVVDRLAHGTITPEDSEAMRAVYPEMMAAITREISVALPQLRENLPYDRRVALSIFSGVPVDAAMRPEILKVLQGQFEDEPGTEGGTQQPPAAPQFGSITKPNPTPAQTRTG